MLRNRRLRRPRRLRRLRRLRRCGAHLGKRGGRELALKMADGALGLGEVEALVGDGHHDDGHAEARRLVDLQEATVSSGKQQYVAVSSSE